jgi:melatonin receptor type 1B
MLMIVGIWILSVSFIAVLYASGLGTFEFYPGRFIYFLAVQNKIAARVFTALSHVTFVLYPMLMTALCYWKVYRIVKGHNASVSSTLNDGPAQNSSSLTKEEIHVTRSVLALVCGFVICWIPCSTLLHVAVYISIPRSAEMVITYTAYASSAINPFVFNIFNKPFRKQFFKVFYVGSRKVKAAVRTGVSQQ